MPNNRPFQSLLKEEPKMNYVLVSVVFIVLVILTNQVLIAVCSEQSFSPLPKGEDYKLKESATSNEWSLKGLHTVATGIALAVKKDPPYGKEKALMRLHTMFTFT